MPTEDHNTLKVTCFTCKRLKLIKRDIGINFQEFSPAAGHISKKLPHHKPSVGSALDFKPSKPYYGFKYNHRHITQHSIGEENGLRCKLGPQCGKNIQKLADAPSFYQTSDPQVGSGLDFKPSNMILDTSNMILDTSHNTQ